jgi:phasin family protein
MYVTPEQIQAANKSNVEAFLAVANAQFAAFEKLANIQASVVKSAFEDSIANTRALLGAKDVQEFVSLQNSFAQPAVEKAMAYSKGVYEVATVANAELSKVAERRVAEWNENFVSLLDKLSKNAPALPAGRNPQEPSQCTSPRNRFKRPTNRTLKRSSPWRTPSLPLSRSSPASRRAS